MSEENQPNPNPPAPDDAGKEPTKEAPKKAKGSTESYTPPIVPPYQTGAVLKADGHHATEPVAQIEFVAPEGSPEESESDYVLADGSRVRTKELGVTSGPAPTALKVEDPSPTDDKKAKGKK